MSETTVSGVRTYVPSFRRTKAVLAICGFVIAGAGALQLWDPVAAVLAGHSAIAEVRAVRVERPGFETVAITVPQHFDEDSTRRLVYGYDVQLPDATEARPINIKNRRLPEYEVGEGVRVVWRDGGSVLFSVWDLRTWAPGVFVLLAGAVFCGAFIHLFLRCQLPIRIPDDTPTDVPM